MLIDGDFNEFVESFHQLRHILYRFTFEDIFIESLYLLELSRNVADSFFVGENHVDPELQIFRHNLFVNNPSIQQRSQLRQVGVGIFDARVTLRCAVKKLILQ